MRSMFGQERTARSAGLFLDGPLGPERRKTGWMRAEAVDDLGPWRQHAVLGLSRWEADALRDVVRDYALEVLADPAAVRLSTRPASSSWASRAAVWRGNTPVRPARSPTAKSGFLLPMSRGMAMR
jgi:hypothetical protein